jgi:hypothetical protein
VPGKGSVAERTLEAVDTYLRGRYSRYDSRRVMWHATESAAFKAEKTAIADACLLLAPFLDPFGETPHAGRVQESVRAVLRLPRRPEGAARAAQP